MSSGEIREPAVAPLASDVAVVLSRLAHDLNNLCASMMGFTALTQESLEPASPVHPYLLEIQHATAQAVALSERLRGLAQQIDGKR